MFVIFGATLAVSRSGSQVSVPGGWGGNGNLDGADDDVQTAVSTLRGFPGMEMSGVLTLAVAARRWGRPRSGGGCIFVVHAGYVVCSYENGTNLLK